MALVELVGRLLRRESPGADRGQGDGGTAAALRCPLCGSTFSRAEAEACAVCPLISRCGLVMCPRCSHEFVPG